MRKKNRTRLHSSIGYYGFGNIGAVFNRRPKPIFEKIKTIYGDELQRYSLERESALKFQEEISPIELNKLRDRIKDSMKKATRKELLKQLLFMVIIIIALISLHYWVYNRP